MVCEDDKIPPPYPGEFLRCVVGSTIHGLSVAGTDDLDLYGICIEPPESVLSMNQPFGQHVFRTQPEGHPSGPGDVDLTCYSLRKYLKLAADGNPTILNVLFVPPEFRHIDSKLADELRELLPLIISKEAGKKYLGYMRSHRDRLLGLKGQKRTGYTRRLKYQSKPDANGDVFDQKYAMHLCRIAVQGVECLTTGKITFPVPEPERHMLMEIRTGKWTLQEIVAWSEVLDKELQAAVENTSLPEHPDRSALNAWLVEKYLEVWKKGVTVPTGA